ncbi:MAG TPA: hypothetical protein VFW92_10170 [Candidatus Limnocylindrales bacterium]|nr:hypothetical protein [Candidatus Limnocylindrales bacterium]
MRRASTFRVLIDDAAAVQLGQDADAVHQAKHRAQRIRVDPDAK